MLSQADDFRNKLIYKSVFIETFQLSMLYSRRIGIWPIVTAGINFTDPDLCSNKYIRPNYQSAKYFKYSITLGSHCESQFKKSTNKSKMYRQIWLHYDYWLLLTENTFKYNSTTNKIEFNNPQNDNKYLSIATYSLKMLSV